MEKTDAMVSKSEAAAAVRQMGRMMADLYEHMAKQMVEDLGEEKAAVIIEKAIWAYGRARGRKQKERVVAAGHGQVPQDYIKAKDLPAFGWDAEPVQGGENPTHVRITYCPFAEQWMDTGFTKLGRLYCLVDQAKYDGFHPDSDMVTLKNVLEGDAYCEMVCRTKQTANKAE